MYNVVGKKVNRLSGVFLRVFWGETGEKSGSFDVQTTKTKISIADFPTHEWFSVYHMFWDRGQGTIFSARSVPLKFACWTTEACSVLADSEKQLHQYCPEENACTEMNGQVRDWNDTFSIFMFHNLLLPNVELLFNPSRISPVWTVSPHSRIGQA